MPVAPHVRLTVTGSLEGTLEKASFSVALANPSGGDSSGYATFVGALAPASLDAFGEASRLLWISAGAAIHNSAYMSEVKLAPIGADGKYQGPPKVKSYAAGAGMYGVGTTRHPPQTALAVTLLSTGFPQKKGRIFLPYNSLTLGTNWLIADADATAASNAVKTWINALNAVIPDNGTAQLRVCIASQASIVKGTAAENRKVGSVRTGKVLDTIRSRRNKIYEVPTGAVATT